MWFGNNTKKIRLSRRLKWGVGKAQHTNTYFWLIGTVCLLAAIGIITRTNQLMSKQIAPSVLGATTTASAEETPALQFEDYKISRGETLFTISQKVGVPTETLAQLNDIKPPFALKAGQTIKVPASNMR